MNQTNSKIKRWISFGVFVFVFLCNTNISMASSVNQKNYYVRSAHGYVNNFEHTWTIKKLGSKRFRVHFNQISTEANYDFVTTSLGDSWDGDFNDVWSSWCYIDEMTVRLKSDGSVTDWGFEIDKIEYEGELIIENSESIIDEYTFESVHPYASDWWYWYWVGRIDGLDVKKTRVHFKWIDTESGYDVLTTSAGDYYSGYYTDEWSSWMDGPKMYMEMSSDGSIQKNGFYIDKIEYIKGEAVSSTSITESYDMQTAHPYTNNYFDVAKISRPFADRIRVHFDYIETETGDDYVNTSAGDNWSGNYYDVWSSWVNASELSVDFSSDGSVTRNGFKIDKIQYEPSDSYTGVINELDSPHNYSNNYNKTWTIKRAGASKIRVHFSKIDTENNYDYLRSSGGDQWSGYYTDTWSSWITGDTIDVTLTSDFSVTDWGFKIDAIETIQAY